MNASSSIARVLPRTAYRKISSTSASTPKSASIDINAVVHRAPKSSQASRRLGQHGPLEGLTATVKDNICTRSMPTTCSSGILRDFTPPYDATVVQLLQENGAEIVGKTNCDEFGMGSLNMYSIHGPVVNPFSTDERRSAGGSSGGSAAAVAASFCDVSLGTDTGGSVRLPASYCGVVGLKPSYGLLSRWGVVSFADSLDCVGIMGRRVSNVKRIFDVLSAYDHRDPTAAAQETRDRASQASSLPPNISSLDNLTGLRIGVPQEYFPAELSSSVVQPIRKILTSLKSCGATIIPVSLPSTPFALSAYYVISSAEASSNMARYDGIQYGYRVELPPGADKTKTSKVYARTRTIGFGKEVKKRILLGTYALTADAFDNYFLQAQRVRQRVKRDFDRVFMTPNVLSGAVSADPNEAGVHVLLHPSSIRTAPPLSESTMDDLESYVQDVLTVPASLAGLPAMSVPAGVSGDDGWPIGASIVGQWGCDEMVMKVGELVENLVERGP